MKRYFDVIVVIPIGPNTNPVFLQDTINSYMDYTKSSFQVILVDDSGQGIGEKLKNENASFDILKTKKRSRGTLGRLYISLSEAYAYILDHYDCKAVLKMDTDALITGAYPEKEALHLFEQNKNTGIAGQYHLDYDGQPWDIAWPKARIVNATMTWKFIRAPLGNFFLRKLYISALKNGYNAGESVFGGACFLSKNFLLALHQYQLLPNRYLKNLNIGEDHLFSLLAKAIGFELSHLASPGLPFALAWKKLPAAPEQLYNEGKKIVHSTRSWKNMNEEAIRSFFKEKREKEKTVSLQSALA